MHFCHANNRYSLAGQYFRLADSFCTNKKIAQTDEEVSANDKRVLIQVKGPHQVTKIPESF